MAVWIFPGQGSQYQGMGREFFKQFPEIIQQADEVLGYSLQSLCLDDPQKQLNQTRYTQPALYTVNALYTLGQREQSTLPPSFVAGHSLGEYNALFAAGMIDFVTGLKLVKKRGELMSQAHNGGMIAVLASGDAVKAVLEQYQLLELDIANYNSPQQTVISGEKSMLKQAESVFSKEQISAIPLNVSAAFHSRYMQDIQKKFSTYLDSVAFANAEIPVIANISARPYHTDDIRDNLSHQISGSVQWVESILYLIRQGESNFIELGPKNVLTKLVERIKKSSEPVSIAVSQAKMSSANHKSNAKRLICPESLGSASFKKDYGLKYAYISGAMAKGIASVKLVVSMGKAGLMGFFGSGGLALTDIENAIRLIQQQLNQNESYGINVLHHPDNSTLEEATIDLLLKYNVSCIEASAFMQITPALVKYRLEGIYETIEGKVRSKNKLIAKLSRPEVANAFLAPPPERILKKLLADGKINTDAVRLAKNLPMADDICVEADSGGHTDMGIMAVLLPAILQLRDEWVQKQRYTQEIRVGAGGGIGSPQAAASAFILGADFILSGSINQCSVEADTSDTVKSILQDINVQDTDYAPAGDMFELGAKVQVVRKGIFFPARANKLYELYRYYPSIDAIDQKTKTQLQTRFFKRSFTEVYDEVVTYHSQNSPYELDKAAQNPKHKMALIFRWYFAYTSRLAKQGDWAHKIDFQIHSGPAMGLFNQWVKNTDLASWQNRHVTNMAEKIMNETAEYLQQRIKLLTP